MSGTETTTAPQAPQQLELPLAIVRGEAVMELPKDLYIPPEAMEVFLESFEGPLDLLLYLIRKQNLDILDIPIADITHQYMEYVELMKVVHFELAAEYLVMAALLAEIKSRMLLPRPPALEEDEVDPRAELIRRLQEYERIKQAAEDIDALPRLGRDNFGVQVKAPEFQRERPHPHVDLDELLHALREVLARADMFTHHEIKREQLSVRERMSRVLERLSSTHFTEFSELFTFEEGRRGVVVAFLAILELVKQSMIELIQTEAYGHIHVKAVAAPESESNGTQAAETYR